MPRIGSMIRSTSNRRTWSSDSIKKRRKAITRWLIAPSNLKPIIYSIRLSQNRVKSCKWGALDPLIQLPIPSKMLMIRGLSLAEGVIRLPMFHPWTVKPTSHRRRSRQLSLHRMAPIWWTGYSIRVRRRNWIKICRCTKPCTIDQPAAKFRHKAQLRTTTCPQPWTRVKCKPFKMTPGTRIWIIWWIHHITVSAPRFLSMEQVVLRLNKSRTMDQI